MRLLPLFCLAILHISAVHFVYNMPSLWRIKTICNFENANEKMPMKLIF